MDLSGKIKSLPDKPGIYQFLDKDGTIIYVGKAKSLKKRVASYFNKAKHRNINKQNNYTKVTNIVLISLCKCSFHIKSPLALINMWWR